MYIYVLNNETKYERKLCFLRIKKTTCFYFSWVCAYRDISTKFWSSSGLAQCESNMTGVEWLTVVCISGKSEQEWVSLLPASIYHLPSGLSLYFGCGWLSPLYFQVLDVCEFYHEISMMFVFFKFFQCSKVIMNCWKCGKCIYFNPFCQQSCLQFNVFKQLLCSNNLEKKMSSIDVFKSF